MRCVCCNVDIIWNRSIKRKKDGSDEDMCSTCINISMNPDNLNIRTKPDGTYAYEYVLEELTSMLHEFKSASEKYKETEE